MALAVTPELLQKVERGEAALRELGFRQFRVRAHGELARIELAPDELARGLDPKMAAQISARVKEAGFAFVALDLDGLSPGLAQFAAQAEVASAKSPSASCFPAPRVRTELLVAPFRIFLIGRFTARTRRRSLSSTNMLKMIQPGRRTNRIWLMAALLAAVMAAGCVGETGADGAFDRSFKVDGPVQLEVATGSGDVRITPGSDGEVRIHGEIRARGWSAGKRQTKACRNRGASSGVAGQQSDSRRRRRPSPE